MSLRILKLLTMFFLVIFLAAFSIVRNGERTIDFDSINYLDSKFKFISVESVDKLLKQQDVSKNLAYLYFDLSELFLACEELNLDATNQIFTAFIKIEKTLSGSYND